MGLQLALGRAGTSTADGSRTRIIANRRASRENPAGNLVREVAWIASDVVGDGTINAINANDNQIGNNIAEAAKKVGKDGIITVAECNRGTT